MTARKMFWIITGIAAVVWVGIGLYYLKTVRKGVEFFPADVPPTTTSISQPSDVTFLPTSLQNETQTQFLTRFFPREWQSEVNAEWGYQLFYPPELELVRHNPVGEDILDMISLNLRRFGTPEPVFQVKVVDQELYSLFSQLGPVESAQSVKIDNHPATLIYQFSQDHRPVFNYYLGLNQFLKPTLVLTAYLDSETPTTTGLTVGYHQTLEQIIQRFRLIKDE